MLQDQGALWEEVSVAMRVIIIKGILRSVTVKLFVLFRYNDDASGPTDTVGGGVSGNESDDEQTPEKLVRIVEEPKERWDCESILSKITLICCCSLCLEFKFSVHVVIFMYFVVWCNC